jgi:hypothetical protein
MASKTGCNGDLISHHRIGIGFQQRLERVIDQLEVDLTQLAFFHGGTPDKSHVDYRSPINPYAIAPAASQCWPRSFALHLI